MNKNIIVTGAKEHNLKNVTVTIPRDQLTVITGLSGSGKSSLAFDTIYAEGQRRYVESLSAYARQFLQMMQKPDVESIEGLSPAISIEQKTTSKNPRSTVGTVTEIYDYMRLLWARVGVPYSPATGKPISSQTVSEMVDRILTLEEGTKLYILAPIVRGRKGEYRKEIQELQKKGFQRIQIDGQIYAIDETPALDKKLKHNIEVVVDRIAVRPDIQTRLADSIETALHMADGILYVDEAKTGERHVFSEKFACPVSGFTIDEIEPRLFSFNNPFGACPHCDGLGTKQHFEPSLVVPEESSSLEGGAIAPWAKSFSYYYQQTLQAVCDFYQIPMNKAWNKLTDKQRDIILYGGEEDIIFTYNDKGRTFETVKPFEGVIPSMTRRLLETDSDKVREELSNYQADLPCDACDGHRLRPEALAVKINKLHISEATAFSIEKAKKWFENINDTLTQTQKEIARPILKEINERLHFLNNVGLDYLTLSRKSGSLSGGESQRIRLASQIGSGLTGVLYVLDEPSIGLHQRDNDRLLETLQRLRDLGNTVIVVEHDEDAIRTADHLIDIGPGAGIHGGEIVAQGTPEDVMKQKSITADYLTGKRFVPTPEKRRKAKHWLEITGATGNNLKDVSAKFPLKTMSCITGVSGSGKSTLTIETLYKALAQKLNKSKALPAPYKELKGVEHLDKIIEINQSPIGRTPRSNPATYTGAFGPIRDWFSGLPESKARGYKPGRFSFNVKGGRCEACQGDGVIKIEMHFLPDVYVTCDTCHGKRYNRETLEIKFKGKSIADVLEMTVEEGCEFFKAIPAVYSKLETLQRVGLGYIHIGQQATTLSGGEAQRVKLSKELAKRSTGKTIYILDEPTTGLHFEDVRRLLEVLHELVDQGNTVLIIEHNLEVIKTADWIVDIGPEGGVKGGQVLAQATPEDLAEIKESYTGQYLKSHLKQDKKKSA